MGNNFLQLQNMKVQIFGNTAQSQELFTKVQFSLNELGLVDFVELESTQDEALKAELNITEEPALIIVEPSIDFKDMIFQGQVPSEDELKSMFVSIVGGESEGGGCGKKDDSGSCGTGCGCG
jgi:hypothetical protein